MMWMRAAKEQWLWQKMKKQEESKGDKMRKKEEPVTEEKAEYLVGQVAASLSFEGMEIPEEEKEMLKKVAMGEIPYEEYMEQLRKG